ncbi:hypothetical protein F5X71_13645 [Nocardia brasiliensis]|uniref:Exosortase/archaeosortase family protein n=1 Tax=Nocardia brasiliensis TaxID=37326 RepID=A0A6G9XQM2_NOCBR|nr:exosortase/archaeosortase family protein [Nocardia brasiliensis]QIS03214.1 hypothetical protein F5X71_13645 [Nocardia brasiliensis]
MARSAGPRHARETIAGIVLRWALLIGLATVAAFWFTWAELVQDIRQGSYLGYIYVLPVLAAFAAIGIALRRGPELPIHDRQTDIIVGLIGLGMSAAVLGLLVPRYRYQYELLHLDVLAAWLFLISGCVLLFGLRPVFRFWPAWLLLLAAFPPLYALLMVTFGGGRVAAGFVMVLLAAFGTGIGAARTRARAAVAVLGVVVLGAVLLLVLRGWFPEAPILVYQAVPSVSAGFLVGLAMYVDVRRGRSMKPLDRRMEPLTAAQSRSAAVTVVIVAALLAIIPLPADYDRSFPRVPGLVIARPDAAPPGWQLLNEQEYPWARRYLGQDAVFTRRMIRAERGNPDWDKESRRRRVAIDTVRSSDGDAIDRYPEFVLYRLVQPRISPPALIDLGHGITARLNTVLDDRRLLSWTWLSWNWSGEGGAERISLIAADNHLPEAEFPVPQRSITANFDNLMNQFLRGNAIVLDSQSSSVEADSEHKDREMLTTLAQNIVRTRTEQP